MSRIFSRTRTWVIIIIVTALAITAYAVYSSRSTKLLDTDAYKEFRDMIRAAGDSEAGGFADQEELRSCIKSWADSHQLSYTEDEAGSIIFDREAVRRKKNFTPTLVCVSMNYETAVSNSRLLASVAAIALSDLDSSRKTVVFVSDEQCLGTGYKKLSKDLVTSKTKVIYLDYGSSSYLSTGSFQERFSRVSIPAEREENPCDTAVKINISGIDSGVAGPSVSKQPDPVSALGTLLSRLKSKSYVYRVADLTVGSNGNMYPVSIEATVALNSYNTAAFTSYINKRIKAWEKAYGKDHENLRYTYEVIDDPEALPETTYNDETTDRLTEILYTIKSGAYRYGSGDSIPDGKDKGDVYGINCLLNIEAEDDKIKLRLMTQGYNDSFIERIMIDNRTAAELYECKYKETKTIDAFSNETEGLSLTFMNTYRKVNDETTADAGLKYDTDNFFTPCSYLAKKNSEADIIHIRMNASTASRVTNTILCYIKTKGNTSFF